MAALVVLWPSAASLQQAWSGIHDYEHGYLIAVLAIVWAVWRFRGNRSQPVEPSFVGSGLLAGALLVWLIALEASSLMAQQLLLPVIVWLAVLACVGWPMARILIAPVAFLYFAIPVWDYATPLLQRLSVLVMETSLPGLGIPVHVNEYTVTIPEGTFEVVGGCSGKRYLIVALAMAVLAGELVGMRRARLFAFLAMTAGLALVANWVRIAIVIYAGHVSHMQHYFVAVEHNSLGQVVFVVLLLAIILLARPLSHPALADRASVPTSGATPALAARAWLLAIPLGVLTAAFAAAQARGNSAPSTASLGALPVVTGKWQGPLPAKSTWHPRFTGPDAEVRVAYASAAGQVEVYANAYGEQQQGRELVEEGNEVLGDWRTVSVRGSAHFSPDLRVLQAHASDGRLWLVAYTFRVAGWSTTSEPLAQLAYGTHSLLRPAPAGLVALAVECRQDCEMAQAVISSFWDDMAARILAVVPNERRTL